MKTLDEVINIFEKACDLERRCEDCSGCLGQEEGCPNDGANAVPDALQYLKEYRELTAELVERNNPLTWEQLKQMEGKPIWLESHGDITEFTGWAIVSNVLEDRVRFIFSHYDGDFLTYEMTLPDCTFNIGWQAYRKER